MQPDESDRRELFDALDTAIGPHPAATLMAHLPPVGWADLATKHDLHELEQRLDLRFEVIDRRFESLEAVNEERFKAIDRRFQSLELVIDERFKASDHRFESLDATLNHRFEGMGERVERTCHQLASELRKEISSLTRWIVIGVGGLTFSAAGVAFIAAKFGA